MKNKSYFYALTLLCMATTSLGMNQQHEGIRELNEIFLAGKTDELAKSYSQQAENIHQQLLESAKTSNFIKHTLKLEMKLSDITEAIIKLRKESPGQQSPQQEFKSSLPVYGFLTLPSKPRLSINTERKPRLSINTGRKPKLFINTGRKCQQSTSTKKDQENLSPTKAFRLFLEETQ